MEQLNKQVRDLQVELEAANEVRGEYIVLHGGHDCILYSAT